MKLRHLLLIVVLLWPGLIIAQTMTSANYRIPFDDLSGGGVFSSSTNYKLTDTVSEQASPTGENLSSANYQGCVGFNCLKDASVTTWNILTSAVPCTTSATGTPPFSVSLGTLSRTTVTTATNHICVKVTTNAPGGVVVAVNGANNGLQSASQPADKVALFTGTLTGTTEGYGICSTSAINGFTAQLPFNGACDTSSNNAIGGPGTAQQTIYLSSGTVSNALGDVLVKAAASASTFGHTDYADTLTFVVAPTF